MNVTDETKAHAQEILDYLIMNPEKHNQAAWYDTGLEDEWGGSVDVVTDENFCGTTMCVAGTSVWLKGGIAKLNEIRDYDALFQAEGALNLGLNSRESDALFYGADNSEALDLLSAIAAGDEEKFGDIAMSHENIYF